MKKIIFFIYAVFVLFMNACHPGSEVQKGKKIPMVSSTEAIPSVVRQLANELPLYDTTAIAFFQKLDSVVIKNNDQHTKQEITCKRYTFYYDLDSEKIASVWMDLNPQYGLTMEQLNETFQAAWKPASSNEMDIKTEDSVVHKKYSYLTTKGKVDITVYSRYDKLTGVLLEFNDQ